MNSTSTSEETRTRCTYCPRFLTDPLSVERGAGPVCWARAQAAAAVAAGLELTAKRRPRKTAGKGKGETAADPRQLSFTFMLLVEVRM